MPNTMLGGPGSLGSPSTMSTVEETWLWEGRLSWSQKVGFTEPLLTVLQRGAAQWVYVVLPSPQSHWPLAHEDLGSSIDKQGFGRPVSMMEMTYLLDQFLERQLNFI